MSASLPILSKKRTIKETKLQDPEITETLKNLGEILEKRKVSPHSKDLVEKIIKDCETALDRDEKDEVFEATKESIVWWQNWLEERLMKDEKYAEEREMIQDLKLHQFLSRYSDYWGQCCTEFRKMVEKLPAKISWKGMFWTDVWNDIKKEDENYEIWQKEGEKAGEPKPLRPLAFQIGEIAKQCCLTDENVRFTIQSYAERNEIAHASSLNELIQNRSWVKIAKTILKDREQLPKIIHEKFKDKEEYLRGPVDMIQQKYFSKIRHHKHPISGKIIIDSIVLKPEIQKQDEEIAAKEEEDEKLAAEEVEKQKIKENLAKLKLNEETKAQLSELQKELSDLKKEVKVLTTKKSAIELEAESLNSEKTKIQGKMDKIQIAKDTILDAALAAEE